MKKLTAFFSNIDYDYHTLQKVSGMSHNFGEIGIHDAADGYILSFDNEDGLGSDRIVEFRARLEGLVQNLRIRI